MTPRARLRAWWMHRQALGPSASPRSVEACIRGIGWLPTAGGPGVYLSVRARMPGVSRETIDRAAVDGTPLIAVPGPYARPPVLVPRDEMALALRLHRATYEKHIAAYVRSGAVDEGALRRLESAICRALDEGPLASADLRKAVNPGDAATLMTGALVSLCLRGVVRRFPGDARIDSPKYLYELLHPDDRPDLDAEGDEAAVARKATEHVLRWHGPATVDELCAWSELTKKAARVALAAAGAEPVAVDGWPEQRWLRPGELRTWGRFTDGADGRVALLPFRDPLIAARSTPGVLTDNGDAPVLKGRRTPARIADVPVLYHHAIVCDGELVGIWDYDPKGKSIVTRLWKTARALKPRIAEAAEETQRFIRDELGDAKLSAVDPPADRARRLAFCRQR